MPLLKAEGPGLGGSGGCPAEGAGRDRIKADFQKVTVDTGGPRSQQRPRAWRSFPPTFLPVASGSCILPRPAPGPLRL